MVAAAPDSGGVMRYDTTSGTYVYHLGLRTLPDPNGSYQITVSGTDVNGAVVTVLATTQQTFGVKWH
jgi:hypothetical protein